MFLIRGGEQTYGLKPMNCPGHMLLFGSASAQLPRVAAAARGGRRRCTATSSAGRCTGSLRVRHVTQDDAHLFVTPEQIEDEIFGCLDYAAYLYDLFGMEARFELSTRPDNKLGTDEEWDFTEAALRSALERRGIEYALNEGDGAFYGPKIDLHMTDVLGRSWQMGTIQLDSQMPARFGLSYVGEDNAEHTPYVVHRALLGSFERFIGILIEHYARRVPGLARAGAGARDPGRRGSPRGGDAHWPRSWASSGSRSTSRTRRWASGSATPRSRRSPTSSSGATRSPTTRSPSASAGASSRRSRLDEFLAELRAAANV